jgi:hypothetical protein
MVPVHPYGLTRTDLRATLTRPIQLRHGHCVEREFLGRYHVQ